MKKICFLTTLLIGSLLLTGCFHQTEETDETRCMKDNSISLDQLIEAAENNIKEHQDMTMISGFNREGSIKSGDKILLYGMVYGRDDLTVKSSDQAVEITFSKDGKLEKIESDMFMMTSHNISLSDYLITGGYLYRNLYLIKEEDKAEYESLQNDKNMILKYQADTSAAVTIFIDVIYRDLLDSCKVYGKSYEDITGTMYERNVCVDNYLFELYSKLKNELAYPRPIYLGDDPILISYYEDLGGEHPFIRYFVDLYTEIKYGLGGHGPLPKYPNMGPITKNPEGGYWNDEEEGRKLAEKYGTGFYTFGKGNVERYGELMNVIGSIASGIVINGQLLDRLASEYGYTFPIYRDDILAGTSPMDGPVVLHVKDEYDRDVIYQILGAGGGSGEFHLIIRMLENGLRIPVGQCSKDGYVLFPTYPTLFGYDDGHGECENRVIFDPLTIFTQEYNLYEANDIQGMAWNIVAFLRNLESIRVLAK